MDRDASAYKSTTRFLSIPDYWAFVTHCCSDEEYLRDLIGIADVLENRPTCLLRILYLDIVIKSGDIPIESGNCNEV